MSLTMSQLANWQPESLNSRAATMRTLASKLSALKIHLIDIDAAAFSGAAASLAAFQAQSIRDQIVAFCKELGDAATSISSASRQIENAQRDLLGARAAITTAASNYSLTSTGGYQVPVRTVAISDATAASVKQDSEDLAIAQRASKKAMAALAEANAASNSLSQALIACFSVPNDKTSNTLLNNSTWLQLDANKEQLTLAPTFDQWIGITGRTITETAGGFIDGGAGLLQGIAMPFQFGAGEMYEFVTEAPKDPVGWITRQRAQMNEMAATAKALVNDPSVIVTSMLDAKKLKEHPERWLGEFGFNLVGAVDIVGAAGVGVKVGAKALMVSKSARAAAEVINKFKVPGYAMDLTATASVPAKLSPLSASEKSLIAESKAAMVGQGGGASGSYRIKYANGDMAIYKPMSQEIPGMERVGFPVGGSAAREVAASRVDKLLGFNMVPTTVMDKFPPFGTGSVQLFQKDADVAAASATYSIEAQDRMAVLDYVIASWDRHAGNYLTAADGSPIAIDNGLSFPTIDGKGVPYANIQSSFVVARKNQPLSPDVLAAVRALNPEDMKAVLQASNIEPSAIDGAVGRLKEIQDAGQITGKEWKGDIIRNRNYQAYVGPAGPNPWAAVK